MQPLRAEGRVLVRAPPAAIRAAILDPAILARIIPGAERVTRGPDGAFTATLRLGVGPFRGSQTVTVRVDGEAGGELSVSGHATGPFGSGDATGRILLHPEGGGTAIAWRYDGKVDGPVAFAGPFLLRLPATAFTTRVFMRLRSIVERAILERA